MDFKKKENEIKSLLEHLDEITKLQNKAFGNLNKEIYDNVKEQHIDMNDMVRKFKQGDFSAIDKYLKKYTTTNASNNKK